MLLQGSLKFRSLLLLTSRQLHEETPLKWKGCWKIAALPPTALTRNLKEPLPGMELNHFESKNLNITFLWFTILWLGKISSNTFWGNASTLDQLGYVKQVFLQRNRRLSKLTSVRCEIWFEEAWDRPNGVTEHKKCTTEHQDHFMRLVVLRDRFSTTETGINQWFNTVETSISLRTVYRWR